MPSSVETSPRKFNAAYPTMKVIEAKFRISVRVEGAETSIVDFLYLITNPEQRLKIQDYLPNTMLESTKADDRIEVTSTTEGSSTTGANAGVNYKTLALGLSRITGSKKTESDHYKQIVPKALILASGTINRQHGVFFKLRPSTGVSLEGAKEFSFLAMVSKEWRADWITIACAARAKRKSFLSTTVSLAGIEQAHVGLYFRGDHGLPNWPRYAPSKRQAKRFWHHSWPKMEIGCWSRCIRRPQLNIPLDTMTHGCIVS